MVRYLDQVSPPPVQEKQVVEKQVYVENSKIIETVKEVSPAVVSIVISKDLPLYRERVFNFNDPFFGDSFFNMPFAMPELDRDENGNVRTQRQKVGGGSGFIVTADGIVVTNRHVIDDPEAGYTVILSNGTEYEADVVSEDTINDVAMLKIKNDKGEAVSGLSVVKIGDSDKIEIGQRVVAIGNALAEYQNTVTTGVISAKGRSLSAGSINSTENLMNLIQTDAAINPGNSGGPLVNLDGEVIGINTAVAYNAQGIGFAIPINDLKPLIESVKVNGRIVRPYLGVRFMMLDEKKAEELKLDVEGGALLIGDEAKGEFAVVPASPAEKAGLKIKDVILEVDGEKVTLEKPLHVLVAQKAPDDEIALKIWRSGETMEVKVTLTEAK
ncbi:trypsin-like peptidase domain-containing protein [Candidatus Peregrinibacteria bacterium]|nr:trypsin-like peptidase domain-containing protein [Candidatus Peregrinibacteria bacterium]